MSAQKPLLIYSGVVKMIRVRLTKAEELGEGTYRRFAEELVRKENQPQNGVEKVTYPW